jgi:predicted Zn-dependent protease
MVVRIEIMKKFLIFIIFFFFSNLNASTIYDYEIELFIHNIIKEVKKVNNYSNKINTNILLDDNPNAFIDHNNQLFISTGLLKYSTSYEGFLGVIAHEIGHLQNFHIAKRKDSIKKMKNINTLTNLSMIAGSLIAENDEYLMQTLITNQVSVNNYYQAFSRDQEREADFYAIKTLNKLQLSSLPLIEFLNYLEKKSKRKGIGEEFFKFSSHPVYSERYYIIYNNKNHLNYLFDKDISKQFNFVKAKLFGFTEKENINLKNYLSEDYETYAESIILSKKGKLKESLKDINFLIKKNKNNIFLLETKADILYANGYLKQSLLFYQKVLTAIPDNNYVAKKIFDIKFSNLNNENSEINELFENYSFLLLIFNQNIDLKDKFKQLSVTLEKKNWLNYFLLEEKINSNELSNKFIIQQMKKIKKLSSSNILNKVITQKIEIINENI